MNNRMIALGLLGLIFISCVALLGGVVGGIAAFRFFSQPQAAIAPPASTEPSPANDIQISTTQIETTITEAIEKIAPTVVTVVGVIPGRQSFFFQTSDQQVSGSGVIINPEGYIITNNHVIEDTADLAVILADGRELTANLVGRDVYADLAVLKVDTQVTSTVVLGDSDLLKPGETVIAIGSPLGDFKNTVTVGVVSATGRILETQQGFQLEGLIQTDAAINQGNSGGPLINLNGEVVGINTLVVRGSGVGSAVAEGLGFAIPANTARVVAEQIIQKGYFARPTLGIRWQPITPRVATAYNLPVQWGVYITDILPGGPAEAAGMQPGDIITRIGETNLDAEHSYVNALFAYSPGESIDVELVRDQRKITLSVTLGETRS